MNKKTAKRTTKATTKAKAKAKATTKAKAKAKATAKVKAKTTTKAKKATKAKAKAKTTTKAKTRTRSSPKRTPEKTSSKKTAARQPADEPATKKPTSTTGGTLDAALDVLRAWAAAGGSLETAPPEDDADERVAAPQPEWGNVVWTLPPSYRAFIGTYSRLAIKWGENIGHDEFVILSPGEMSQTGAIVYMPADVSRDPGKYLSTNHLVPFASGGNDECAFCFDVTAKTSDGEYPVYFHHQDEPRARFKDTGAWEDPADATPDFPNFTAWLAWVATELGEGREPESSYPSAFRNMPGRKNAV